MRLYIARHGQTLWNTQKRMQGWSNSDLTQLGIKQAKLLGEALMPIEFNQVISSPLERTVETSKYILGGRKTDFVVNEDFKEMGFGSWEGQSPETLQSTYPEQYKKLWTGGTGYVPIDGESFEQVYKRVIRGMESIIQDNPEGHVLLITHGMIIQVLLVYLKGLSPADPWTRGVVSPGSLTVVDINPGKPIEIIKEACISHLE